MSLSYVCVVTNALRLKRFKSDFSNYEYTSFKKNNDSDEERKTKIMKTIYIEGMQCNHCKMTVEKVLKSIDGVTNVEVNLENKNAIIESEKELDNNEIKRLIEEEGFSVREIK